MNRVKKNHKLIILISILALALIATLVLALCRESWLTQYQQQALKELEEKQGEYADNSIMLCGTNAKNAAAIAERIGASLRITKDGNFAALFIPSVKERLQQKWIVPLQSPINAAEWTSF